MSNNLLFYLIDRKIEELNREHYNMKTNEDMRLLEINYWNYVKKIISTDFDDKFNFEIFYEKNLKK